MHYVASEEVVLLVHVVPPKPRVETGYWQYTGHATSRPGDQQPPATGHASVRSMCNSDDTETTGVRSESAVIMESKPFFLIKNEISLHVHVHVLHGTCTGTSS